MLFQASPFSLTVPAPERVHSKGCVVIILVSTLSNIMLYIFKWNE